MKRAVCEHEIEIRIIILLKGGKHDIFLFFGHRGTE